MPATLATAFDLPISRALGGYKGYYAAQPEVHWVDSPGWGITGECGPQGTYTRGCGGGIYKIAPKPGPVGQQQRSTPPPPPDPDTAEDLVLFIALAVAVLYVIDMLVTT